jgi:hypothetical protein
MYAKHIPRVDEVRQFLLGNGQTISCKWNGQTWVPDNPQHPQVTIQNASPTMPPVFPLVRQDQLYAGYAQMTGSTSLLPSRISGRTL